MEPQQNPKGVIISHRNILGDVDGLATGSDDQNILCQRKNLSYLAYLPSSHIFEFSLQFFVLACGGCIHFASPFTLTDKSPSVVPGEPGDATLAKPFFMVAVPLVLKKIKTAIELNIAERGPTFEDFFKFCLDYKLRWRERGFRTPILDKLIFSKINKVLGGDLGILVIGGAQVPPEIHQFFRLIFCEITSSGYGATETTGAVIFQDVYSLKTSELGHPLYNMPLYLEQWEEGGYYIDDPSGPAGEIIIGGPVPALGYFKHDDPYDNVAIFTDDQGNRWFRTGDIGKIDLERNCLKLIDRKKQLLKLLNGEYVSLGRIERVLGGSQYIDTICTFARPTERNVVAIVIPNQAMCKMLLMNNKVKEEDEESLLKNEDLSTKLLDKLKADLGSLLTKYEFPRALTLVDGPWMPDSGLVTGAMKVRRHMVEKKYQNEVNNMFKSLQM